MMTMEQIRINAILGVSARQRELAAENRKLRKQINQRYDDIAGMVGFSLAVALVFACIVF